MSTSSRVFDTFYAIRFLRLLTTPWKYTTAFKLGLVDEKGERLKDSVTPEEKSAYTIFHRLVFNVKRLVGKLPFELGKGRIASYITAFWMLREECHIPESDLIKVLQEATGFEEWESILEDWKSLDEAHGDEHGPLQPGFYITKNPLASVITKEFLVPSGSMIIVEESLSEPIGSAFGCKIYKGTHIGTKTKVYFTRDDVTFDHSEAEE